MYFVPSFLLFQVMRPAAVATERDPPVRQSTQNFVVRSVDIVTGMRTMPSVRAARAFAVMVAVPRLENVV